MGEPKQVIVIRRDLGMRKGKACAQVAHASMKFLVDKLSIYEEETDQPIVRMDEFDFSPTEAQWLAGSFIKIVLSVNGEAELEQVAQEAEAAGLLVKRIVDEGRTEFKEPTFTCIAVGPDEREKIDRITGLLPTW